MRLRAALTLPKLSAYSRHSEVISCTEGWGWASLPHAAKPRTLVPMKGPSGTCPLPPHQCPRCGDPRCSAPNPITHLAAVMSLGHQQHAADEVCGGHALGAFALSGDRDNDTGELELSAHPL